MRSSQRCLVFAAALGLAGCVDGFRGSNVQIDFSAATPIPALPGQTPDPNQPPDNTFFLLFAVDQELDASGAVIREYLFEVQRFELRPVIDLSSPCMIDVEGTPYPGLHVAAFADKEKEATGITDSLNPPPGIDPVYVQRVLTAEQRLRNAQVLQEVKAVTSTSVSTYPGVAPDCAEAGADPSLVPPAGCTGDQSNARRLELCNRIWELDPLRYEGTDRVLTQPLNGTLFGFVLGSNPINGAGLGGAQLFVDENLAADAYAINWQYKDGNSDGQPDYPPTVPDDQKSPTGFRFLTGYPEVRTRGVVHVPMAHLADPSISALVAIFEDLGDDSVQF